jgi:hypothetical protein
LLLLCVCVCVCGCLCARNCTSSDLRVLTSCCSAAAHHTHTHAGHGSSARIGRCQRPSGCPRRGAVERQRSWQECLCQGRTRCHDVLQRICDPTKPCPIKTHAVRLDEFGVCAPWLLADHNGDLLSRQRDSLFIFRINSAFERAGACCCDLFLMHANTRIHQ